MCIFCKIANKEIPADIVYEDNETLAFKDINPKAPVHILVIPKKHVESLATVKDFSIVSKIAQLITKIASKQGVAESGYRVVTNIGPDSGQEVPHLHFHIFGGRKMNWPPG